jgi:hypothetical protein
MKKAYSKPSIVSEKSFETSALSCGKTATPPTGSRHFAYSYDTFTGHFGPGFGGAQSTTGSAGVGSGPAGGSSSYGYTALCSNWVSIAS